MKTILYGICGIGNGHFYRQLPIISKLLQDPGIQIIFFAYQSSLVLLNQYFQIFPNVKIFEVNVPYYKGDKLGLNFEETSQLNKNFNFNINFDAFAKVQKITSHIDLVISDYEPFSAQLGYAYGAQVITIDQQSKFFTQNTPSDIQGFTCRDEVMRLGMFFPKATRLACSFFNVEPANDVQIFAPIFRPELKKIKPTVTKNNIVVYLSAQNGFQQSLDEFLDVLRQFSAYRFDVYVKNATPSVDTNLYLHSHGDPSFDDTLARCEGVISTAGHSLLSECMFLGKPVYAMPMALYEQQLNAKIIDDYCLGMKEDVVVERQLNKFLSMIQMYRYNISHSIIINRGDGLDGIMRVIYNNL